LRRFPGFTDLVFAQALASLSLGKESDAIAYWEQCIEMGDAPARYLAASGTGTYLPRISLAELYLRRGELGRARELLDWCIAEHPEFIGIIDPYATVLLRSGVAPDAVIAQIEARVPDLTPAARFLLGSSLYRHGAMAGAETQFRAVLDARPASAQVRVRLAEALLNQRRYAEAAAESAQIDDVDAYAGLAARIELWSRVANGDFDGAAMANLRAGRLGISAAEREVFSAWLDIASGESSAPRRLPVASTPLLGVILETLLRCQDFEAFERLLPLLRASALPEREQREQLASMYLAQGFLPQAAQEWMVVCGSAPDARALLGLARVAERHGQREDAAVFAGEALQLDPSSAPAREILVRCSPAVSEAAATK
jgi:tetratricopeptide (TPR) repeat protein